MVCNVYFSPPTNFTLYIALKVEAITKDHTSGFCNLEAFHWCSQFCVPDLLFACIYRPPFVLEERRTSISHIIYLQFPLVLFYTLVIIQLQNTFLYWAHVKTGPLLYRFYVHLYTQHAEMHRRFNGSTQIAKQVDGSSSRLQGWWT